MTNKLAENRAKVWRVLTAAAHRSQSCPTNQEFSDATGVSIDSVRTCLANLETSSAIFVHRKTNARRIVLLKSGDATGWTDTSKRSEYGRRAKTEKKRNCLTCGAEFLSSGPGNRLCPEHRAEGDHSASFSLNIVGFEL